MGGSNFDWGSVKEDFFRHLWSVRSPIKAYIPTPIILAGVGSGVRERNCLHPSPPPKHMYIITIIVVRINGKFCRASHGRAVVINHKSKTARVCPQETHDRPRTHTTITEPHSCTLFLFPISFFFPVFLSVFLSTPRPPVFPIKKKMGGEGLEKNGKSSTCTNMCRIIESG